MQDVFSDSAYKARFNRGYKAEVKLADWFKKYGWTVQHIEKVHRGDNKGPRDESEGKAYRSTDMNIFKKDGMYAVEVKTSRYSSYYIPKHKWQVPMRADHFLDYSALADTRPHDIYIYYVILGSQPQDTVSFKLPKDPPTGIYRATINKLQKELDHPCKQKKPPYKLLVFFNLDSFEKVADLDDLGYDTDE